VSPINDLNRQKEVDFEPECSHSVLMPESTLNEADTVALMAELRELCAKLSRQWAVSEVELHRVLRNFAQPELSAPARSYQFKVEQWDKTEDHVLWLIAVSNNFLVARAAYEAAVQYNPRERWLLRDGIRVVERYEP
jgi:hypothetical protein